MKKIKTVKSDSFFYFYILFICLLLITAISLFSKPVGSSGLSTQLVDSLNSPANIYFDFGKSELRTEAFPVLDLLASELVDLPGSTIEVIGHTDDVGSYEFNINLSEKRAEAVKNYLVSKGCKPDQIITDGKGKSEPVTANISEEDRSLNRRVEFKWNDITKKEEPKDIEYVNSNIKKTGRNEIEGEISVRDTFGDPIKGIEENDVSAVLKWKDDSTAGTVHFLPIDDKKKTAFTLVMDYSPSMFGIDNDYKKSPKGKKVELTENAVKHFIDALGPNTFLKVIKFGRDIDVVQRFTKSKEIMANAIDLRSYPRGGTALFTAIYLALKDTTYDSNPTIAKTVIAFTDGMDNSSGKINMDSIFSASDSKAIKVYTIGLLDKNDEFSSDEERQQGEKDLKKISGMTGGFFYYAKDASSLEAIYKQIFDQITGSYHVTIKWNEEKLPSKGTVVEACISVKIKGNTRILYKSYVME